jgi:hypothetical protein
MSRSGYEIKKPPAPSAKRRLRNKPWRMHFPTGMRRPMRPYDPMDWETDDFEQGAKTMAKVAEEYRSQQAKKLTKG